MSRHRSLSGGEGWASGKVELPAFMHEELTRPVAQLPQLPTRRAVPASSESSRAPRDKAPMLSPPRVRPPTLLGMPWRWL